MERLKAKHVYKCHFCGKKINAGQYYIRVIVSSWRIRRFCLKCEPYVQIDLSENKID